MKEAAKRMIGKECIVYMLNGQMTGVIREVDGNSLVLEPLKSNTDHPQTDLVNLDFVMRIQEYPRRKSGRKKAIVLE